MITVTATVEDLPGNTESLVPHVATRARTANFVADDFGRQFVGAVNVSGALPCVHSSWLLLHAPHPARWLSWLHVASDVSSGVSSHGALCGVLPVSHLRCRNLDSTQHTVFSLFKCASHLRCFSPLWMLSTPVCYVYV